MPETEARNLTDKDVEAIVDALEERITKKFYTDLGKGVWATVWRLLVALALFLAAYGANKGIAQ